MNLVGAVPIVVASILIVTVNHGEVSIIPLRHSIIDGAFIGVDQTEEPCTKVQRVRVRLKPPSLLQNKRRVIRIIKISVML